MRLITKSEREIHRPLQFLHLLHGQTRDKLRQILQVDRFEIVYVDDRVSPETFLRSDWNLHRHGTDARGDQRERCLRSDAISGVAREEDHRMTADVLEVCPLDLTASHRSSSERDSL